MSPVKERATTSFAPVPTLGVTDAVGIDEYPLPGFETVTAVMALPLVPSTAATVAVACTEKPPPLITTTSFTE